MLAQKGLTLPIGTKVKMTETHGEFNLGDIVERTEGDYDDRIGVMFFDDNSFHYLSDSQWELIEEPGDEIQEPTLPNQGDEIQVATLPNQGDEIQEPTLPNQGDEIQVATAGSDAWEDCTFICFYKDYVIAWGKYGIEANEQWRFPIKEEVTLSDGNTYFVEERDGIKCLVEK